MFDINKFGSTVRFVRKSKGLTILQFALELSISDRYLAQIETGSKIPSIELVVWILNYFGMNFEQMNTFFDSETNLTNIEYKNMLHLLDSEDCLYLYDMLKNCEWVGDNH